MRSEEVHRHAFRHLGMTQFRNPSVYSIYSIYICMLHNSVAFFGLGNHRSDAFLLTILRIRPTSLIPIATSYIRGIRPNAKFGRFAIDRSEPPGDSRVAASSVFFPHCLTRDTALRNFEILSLATDSDKFARRALPRDWARARDALIRAIEESARVCVDSLRNLKPMRRMISQFQGEKEKRLASWAICRNKNGNTRRCKILC